MDRKQKGARVLLSKKQGGNKKPQTFRICAKCGAEFGPLERLTRIFCSRTCAYSSRCRKSKRVCVTKARNAQSLLRYHIIKGHIKRPLHCEECGKKGVIEASHSDYNKALEVRWLCVSCHRRIDKKDPKNVTRKVPI